MIRATFSGFTTAQLAMAASQRALDVTGQNIANINTTGYTRQRLDTTSFNAAGGNYYSTNYTARIGNGVLVTGVSQLRDPYLDIQYRRQIADVGAADSKDAILSEIANIFDETDRTKIQSAYQELDKQLSSLANGSGSDSMVRSAMEVLVNLFHSSAISVDKLREQETNQFEDLSIGELNGIIKDITKLNDSIKNGQLLGNPCLELQDQRNQKLDELATYLPISVSYRDEQISSTDKLSILQVTIQGPDGRNISLIDGDKYGSFSASTADKVTSLDVTDINGDTKQLAGKNAAGEIFNSLESGVYKGTLDMLNSAGAFNGTLGAEKGIGYYEASFNLLVSDFANLMNTMNGASGPNDPNALFSTIDGSGEITASNIKISDNWKNGSIALKKGTGDNPVSGDITNINRIQEELKKNRDFNVPGTTNKLYTGDFYGFYTNMQGVLGIDQKSTTTLLKNTISVVNQTNQSRQSVSGVNLDEEGVSLMHYQQSYTAACRLMTALDEALDTLINNTGRVGR